MSASKTKLSKYVLEMKFMKKSKEKLEQCAEDEEKKILFNSEIPDSLLRGKKMCVIEHSFVPCEQLQFGRFSFKGMNPEVERLMRENQLKDLEKLKQMDGISDKEMAQRYSTLVDSMKKKFMTKRKIAEVEGQKGNSPKQKQKFLRPPDDS